ncbi:hypothetical protein [Pontibacter kalidii]|uniref:hypothetical protein n=1 Tax=Pontibacter kalidii TaxID=2592049 RepID=UPI002252E3CC|nr:hypothetical protein [Pontibacter kalidii]
MDELKSLAKIAVESNNSKQMLPNFNKSSKEGMFYNNLMQDNYIDDAVASMDLYGSSPNDVKYKMLKVRLKKKLYNSLFFYDKHKLKKAHQKEQECLHLLHHAHLLLRLKEPVLVLSIAAKVKKIAIQYEYINFVIAALELEMDCYSKTGSINSFLQAKQELEKFLNIKKYEREAVTFLQLLKVKYSKSIKHRRAYLSSITDDVDNMYRLWKAAKSFEAFNAYYKASIIFHEMVGDFSAIIDLTVSSEDKLASGEVNSLRFDSNYNKFILVYAHFRAKQLLEGLQYASKFHSDFEENTPNWFAYTENYFLIALHAKEYELAGHLLHKVFSNPHLKRRPAFARERWTLFQAYYNLVGEFFNHEDTVNPFFLSLPVYSKDKQGYNVAILILQFIYFLQKKETEALLYRIESLKKYILTHLRDTFSLRSKTFLKLLILIVTEDYDVVACKKKGQKLYQKLIETPIPGDAYAEIEIVPYEHLWEHILDRLEIHYK